MDGWWPTGGGPCQSVTYVQYDSRTIDMSLLVTMVTSDSAGKMMVICDKKCRVASEADGDCV